MIRRAEKKDMERIVHLLLQVQDVHAKGRPDYFNPGARKYSDKELEELLEDDSRPIYVYEDEQGIVQGYAFLEIEVTKDSLSRKDRRSIYIDDLCVDETARGKHIGTALFSYVEELAKEMDFDSITLNVWECNPGARAFYESLDMEILKTTMEKRLK